jgi:C4-dicarboxylate transporter DctM subunit
VTVATLILFLVFFGLLFLGVPIPGAIGISLFQNSVFTEGASLDFVTRAIVKSMDSFPILAIPMFILAGEIMGKGGISKRLFDFANACLGKVTGGVPMATVLTCMLFGAISGSGSATFAAVGTLMIPLMAKQGYQKPFVTALTASSGGLGTLIPPSIPMVMYAISANQSIGDMFLAGVFPGILAGVCLMVYTYIFCKRHPIPAGLAEMETLSIWESVKSGFWALLTPIIILGGIYGGIFTATEAAAVAVVYGILVSRFIYRTITFKELPNLLVRAANSNSPILIIVALATVFGRVLTIQNIPQQVADGLLAFSSSPVVILILINLLLIAVGMLMEALASIIIVTPILLPIATAIGIDPVHFGVIMVANLVIGFVTPPVGTNLFVASGLTGMPIMDVAKAAIGPIIALLIALIIIVACPPLSLILVK